MPMTEKEQKQYNQAIKQIGFIRSQALRGINDVVNDRLPPEEMIDKIRLILKMTGNDYIPPEQQQG